MASIRKLVSPLSTACRSLSTAPALYSKTKAAEDPIKKLFLDKLSDFKKQKDVPMSPEVQKEFKNEITRLNRIYGADKEDLSQFPSFSFKD